MLIRTWRYFDHILPKSFIFYWRCQTVFVLRVGCKWIAAQLNLLLSTLFVDKKYDIRAIWLRVWLFTCYHGPISRSAWYTLCHQALTANIFKGVLWVETQKLCAELDHDRRKPLESPRWLAWIWVDMSKMKLIPCETWTSKLQIQVEGSSTGPN